MTANQDNLSVSDLQEQLKRQTRELEEARDERVALAEVLRIVASSPNDAQPVFESIVNSVPRLCQAKYCWVFRFDGELIHFAAEHGLSHETVEAKKLSHTARKGLSRRPRDSYLRHC
jgi:two-component system, NtrC family, sensor kinase